MATRLSPGIYVNEFDFSDYAPVLGLATFAVCGGATKGKLNTPTAITNEADLIRAFGAPVLSDYGLQAAIQFLKKGNRLLFNRVAHNAATADIPVPGLSGGTDAVKATGYVRLTGAVNPLDGETVSIRDRAPQCQLQNDTPGLLGNQPIVPVGVNIAITGMSGGTASVRATGSVKLLDSAQPATGNTVTISDGVTPVTFEFTNGVPGPGGTIIATSTTKQK